MSTQEAIMPGQVWVVKGKEKNPFLKQTNHGELLRVVVDCKEGFVLYDLRNGFGDKKQFLVSDTEKNFRSYLALSKHVFASDLQENNQQTNHELHC